MLKKYPIFAGSPSNHLTNIKKYIAFGYILSLNLQQHWQLEIFTTDFWKLPTYLAYYILHIYWCWEIYQTAWILDSVHLLITLEYPWALSPRLSALNKCFWWDYVLWVTMFQGKLSIAWLWYLLLGLMICVWHKWGHALRPPIDEGQSWEPRPCLGSLKSQRIYYIQQHLDWKKENQLNLDDRHLPVYFCNFWSSTLCFSRLWCTFCQKR